MCICIYVFLFVTLGSSLQRPELLALCTAVAASEHCLLRLLCRFSHGQVVSVDELRPFQDPDLSLLQVGSACLAKHQDGLWHPARITGEDGRKDFPKGALLKLALPGKPLCFS